MDWWKIEYHALGGGYFETNKIEDHAVVERRVLEFEEDAYVVDVRVHHFDSTLRREE